MISRGAMFAQAARGPVLLITVGILFALQQAGVLAFARSWPLLIIAIGVMKLFERLLGGPPPPIANQAPGYRPPYANQSQAPAEPTPPQGSFR